MARAEQYYHSLLRRAKWRTYALPEPVAPADLEAMKSAIAEPAPWTLPDPEIEAAAARFDKLT